MGLGVTYAVRLNYQISGELSANWMWILESYSKQLVCQASCSPWICFSSVPTPRRLYFDHEQRAELCYSAQKMMDQMIQMQEGGWMFVEFIFPGNVQDMARQTLALFSGNSVKTLRAYIFNDSPFALQNVDSDWQWKRITQQTCG